MSDTEQKLGAAALTNRLECLSNTLNSYTEWGPFIICTHYYGSARNYSIEAKARCNKDLTVKELKQILVKLRKAIKESRALGFTEEYIEVNLENGWWE